MTNRGAFLPPRVGIRSRGTTIFLALAIATIGAGVAPAVAHARSSYVRVIVTERTGTDNAARDAVRALGGRVERLLPLIHAFAARVPLEQVAPLSHASGVASVAPNRRLTVRSTTDVSGAPGASLDVVRATVGADRVGNDGAGVDVALVDTGVAPVPGLAGRVVDGPDFSADGSDPSKAHLDGFGHGTHLAGIIAGLDPATGFRGIAPGARVVNVRVADHDGTTTLVELLAGVDWVVRHAHGDGLNIRVLTLAVGGEADGTYVDDPLSAAIEQAWRHGVTVVVAAGNGGNDTAALDSPAWDPYIIAAGASDDSGTAATIDDLIAEFSSRGTDARSPDVVAPGVAIVSLRVSGSLLDQTFPEAEIGDAYFRGSGSSQSAAVTAGAVALLSARRPDLGPDHLKALLRAGAHPLSGVDMTLQGAGTIDVTASVVLPVPSGSNQRWQPARVGGAWHARYAGVELAVEGPPGVDANSWRANSWRANSWRANSWRSNRWTANSWRANSWRANSWRANSWRANSWRANSWRANSWRASAWMGDAWEVSPGS